MFRRLANLIKGFLSLFVSGIEKSNPEAVLEAEKEHLREQIAQYNQGLASHAALVESLMSQIKRLETEETELRAKTTVQLRAGNREVAAQYALRLQTATNELVENRKQLEQAEKTYKDLLKARDVSIAAAKAKLDSLKRGIDDMKIAKAQAELTEMASGMISSIGSAGDTLDRLHEMVEEEKNKAAGRARVARDSLNTNEIEMKEAEQKAIADQALADFAAKEGIALAPTPGQAVDAAASAAAPPADATKTMGPTGTTQ